MGAVEQQQTLSETTVISSTTTAATGDRFVKREHGQKMLSLDNVVTREQLDLWLDRVAKAAAKKVSAKEEEDPDESLTVTLLTEPKLDGLSLSVRYSPTFSTTDGAKVWQLQWAATRGDGRVGQDVTSVVKANLETFGISAQLSDTPFDNNGNDDDDIGTDTEIRGEVVFPNSLFFSLDQMQSNFYNPRNAASGILLRKHRVVEDTADGEAKVEESSSALQGHLKFMTFAEARHPKRKQRVLGTNIDSAVWTLVKFWKKSGFNMPTPFVSTTLTLQKSQSTDENDEKKTNDGALTWNEDDLVNLLEYHEKMGEYREQQQQEPQKTSKRRSSSKNDWDWGDYGMDGCVHKVSGAELRTAMGDTNRAPKWAVAHKFPAQAVVTQLLGMEVQVGRTGALTPVAVLAPVELEGAPIQRATLHNFVHMRHVSLNSEDAHTINMIQFRSSFLFYKSTNTMA